MEGAGGGEDGERERERGGGGGVFEAATSPPGQRDNQKSPGSQENFRLCKISKMLMNLSIKDRENGWGLRGG